MTLGFLRIASRSPVNIPTPIVGFMEVTGAAIKASRIVRGWAIARSAPRAESVPLIIIQLKSIEKLLSRPERVNPVRRRARTAAGIIHGVFLK